MRFENQSAIVTGAGRGIGHAIAVRLASEGARVACVSRSEDNAKRTADEINILRTDSAKHYAVDVADHATVQKIGAQILEDFTKIDILVNNAGVTRDGLAMRMSVEDWDTVINSNLRGAFNFTQAIIRAMIKQRSGRIINITSVIGLIGNAGQTNYAASKAGLIGFTKSLARELASRNITVNAVAPGFVTTDMTAGLSDEIKNTIHAKIPLGRTGTPDDIASAVAFLASAEAAYITGQVLCVDGGIVMSEAVHRSLGYRSSRKWLAWSYDHIPGFAAISETAYKFIARHRGLGSTFTRLLWGKDVRPPTYIWARRWLLPALRLTYLVALASHSVHVDGLVR